VKPSIDVIIPTYNRPTLAKVLVDALAGRLTRHDHVYVVWQGKDKPNIQDSQNVHCIRSSPPNLPRARNRGIAEGSGDICLFLDDDVEILSTDLLELHRKTYGEQRIGGIAGYIEDCMFESKGSAPSQFDETTGEIIQNFSLQESQFTLSVMGAHMSFKRQALVDAGGFDENFKANALWEEIDCAFRVRRADWEIYYCAEAKVRHLRDQLGGCRHQKENSTGYRYHQFANTAYFAARYAKPRNYPSWIRFWKYRLEFFSRKKGFFLKHDLRLVLAGILGALGGITRYLKNRKK
jgi:GT2 family glycosyltransferase